MDKILDFIEKHKYGIIVALMVHVLLFIYFQVTTYQELVSYEPWSFRGKNIPSPDDILLPEEEIVFDGEIDLQSFEDREISSVVAKEGDTRKASNDPTERYTSYEGDAYANIKAFEQQVVQQLQEGNKSKVKASSFQIPEENGEEGTKKESGTQSNAAGSKHKLDGETMVRYQLAERFPFNNNDWHVRNPGYTCGNVNGTIVVAIKVNNNGDVISAKYIPEESNNVNYCMIRQAEKYAQLSRFNYAPNAPKNQDGKITYIFVYRK